MIYIVSTNVNLHF